MLSTPFLTDLDARAAVKGSRDPLGIQGIWTRLGRHVVGNLTTVTTSVRDFTTTLLGYYFAELIADEAGPGTELATFLKFEQLAAYSRGLGNDDWKFRGTERARKNCSEGSRLTISADRAHQILSNQKIYGLWGLFTVPSRASGLLVGDPPRLTPPARELVEQVYLPLLEHESARTVRRLTDVLRSRVTTIDVEKADAMLIKSIARVLKRKLLSRERDFYQRHLLYGGSEDATAGRQARMAELLTESCESPAFSWSPLTVEKLARTARKRGADRADLGSRLDRIRVAESVLAPASVLFSHLLGFDGKAVATVAKRLEEQWGTDGLPTIDTRAFVDLRTELGDADEQSRDRWIGIADVLSKGQYEKLVKLLMEQNQAVMADRNGMPWLVQREARLQVHFRDERGVLPARSEVKSLWVFPYFLDSLRSIAAELVAA